LSAYQDNLAGITTSTGLSTLIVNAADPRFKSFSALATGTGYCYRIEMLADNAVWQTGRFSWNSSTSTATITSTKTSSNGGSAINWAAGSKLFMLTADSELLRDMAEMVESTDALILTTAERSIIAATSGTNTGDQNLSDYQLEPSEGAFADGDKTKLDGIEAGAETNNINDTAAADLTDSGNSGLHFHSTDRDRANHSGTQTAATISDFGIGVSNNADVTANSADRHVPVTVTNSAEINFTLAGQDITAELVGGSIDESKLDSSVNASLDLADSATQPADIADFETTTELNGRDTANRDRANHTGSQLAATVSDFAATVRGAVLSGISFASTTTITAADSILSALGRLQAQVTLNTAKTGVTEEISNVVEDTTPQLGGNLDAQRKDITAIRRMQIAGQAATYIANPGAFIALENDQTYNYTASFGSFAGLIIPSAVDFKGVHTLAVAGFPFGMGLLFNAQPTLKNSPAVVANFSPFFVLNGQVRYEADTQSITMGFGVDINLGPTLGRSNGGTLAVTDYRHAQISLAIEAGVTLTNRQGFLLADATGAGTITNQAGIVIGPLTKATNNVAVLFGTTTSPAGNFGVYQASNAPNRWNGGQRFRTRQATTTAVTVTASDGTVEMSNTGTVTCTLPSATTCEGLLLTLVKTGASGTLNIASVSAQTSKGIDRTATPWVFTDQWTVLQIQSNGTNWTTLINGVPA